VLLRRAVKQDFLKFFHGASVDDSRLAIPQARMILSPEHESLNVRRGKAFAAARFENDAQIEPLRAAGRDLEARLDALQVLPRAPLETFLQRHFPLALQVRELAGEEFQDGILPEQLEFSLSIGPAKTGALQA
jgi:hypothetical protein